MEYAILLLVVIGCAFLIWYLSQKTHIKTGEANPDNLLKAAQHGDVFAQYALAMKYRTGNDMPLNLEEACRWCKMAADQGYAEAQYQLACFLDKGEGCAKSPLEARKWYNKAALQGHQAAQNIISSEKWTEASMETAQEPAAPSIANPYASLSLSLQETVAQAEQGDIDAQYNLGIIFYNGEGVDVDHTQAFKWFNMAAQQGDAEAQFNLGLMYGKGEGIAKDHKVSKAWFEKAAEQGHSEAKEILSRLGKR